MVPRVVVLLAHVCVLALVRGRENGMTPGMTPLLRRRSHGSGWDGRAPVPIRLPNALQTLYQRGTPHTDRHGNRLLKYDAAASFLPLVVYDAMIECNSTSAPAPYNNKHPEDKGQNCLPQGFDASIYTAANFTGVLPYTALVMADYMDSFARHGLQVIRQNPCVGDGCNTTANPTKGDEPVAYHNHPNLLGWYLAEEPTGVYPVGPAMDAAWSKYTAKFAAIKAVDPHHPIFVLDCPWISNQPWWDRWNSYGDVSSHDNYALDYRYTSLATINGDGGGIPQTVSLAASINNESKPVWLCVQAFESGPWVLPNKREMRGQVYTGIVHGATGIIFFAMDSYATRAGGVVGMAPRSLLAQTYRNGATGQYSIIIV